MRKHQMTQQNDNSNGLADDEIFMTVKEAAAFLRLKPCTLDLYRCEGRGPEYRKHGSRVYYTKAALIEWSKNRRYASTSKRIRKKK